MNDGGIETLTFSFPYDLEQIIYILIHIPDWCDHAPNILGLFFTSNPKSML